MKYSIIFLMLSGLAGAQAFNSNEYWSRAICIVAALCSLGLCVAYSGFGPGIFLKKPDGHLPLLSWIIFAPYLVLTDLAFRIVRITSKENAWDEIAPGLFLGRRLVAADESKFREIGVLSVLDLTCEFSESDVLRKCQSYCVIPSLDAYPPRTADLKRGAEWIEQNLKVGPVYVHCALGHGRSATFVAAYLIRAGIASEVDSAIEKIRTRRPGVGLTKAQRSALLNLT